MTLKDTPVLIFDLDETVLTINSFPRWVKYLLVGPMPEVGAKRIALSLKVAHQLALRKAGFVDHERLKWNLQKICHDTAGGTQSVRHFALSLLPFVRDSLRDILGLVAAGRVDAVLATAAAADYAVPLGTQLGFRHIIATEWSRPEGQGSTVGENKRKAVLRLLTHQGWDRRDRVLFTDHPDDLPLIGLCNSSFWFGSARGGDSVRKAFPHLPLYEGADAVARLATLCGRFGPVGHPT